MGMWEDAENAARKAAGLPPVSEAEREALKRETEKIRQFGDRVSRGGCTIMQMGCSLVFVAVVVFVALALI